MFSLTAADQFCFAVWFPTKRVPVIFCFSFGIIFHTKVNKLCGGEGEQKLRISTQLGSGWEHVFESFLQIISLV